MLQVEGLVTEFATRNGIVRAVDGLGFAVNRGETLALVGESGSGKSVTALSILRLVPPPGRIVAGRILFDGVDLGALDERDIRAVRGGSIGMIFQEPMTALNPVMTIGDQIIESLIEHSAARNARARAVELLDLVRLPEPQRKIDDYPHRLSGGMRQRAMIAMALACRPRLLIADEPTTALDVTIQAQILDLLARMQAEFGMALLLITHDVGVVAEMADRVVVMYAGRKAEEAPVDDFFAHPLHPYSQGLLAATPGYAEAAFAGRFAEIPGAAANVAEVGAACAFAPRCPKVMDRCRAERPGLRAMEGRETYCFADAGRH
jgi:peptide/nickel transport system ATP-binding protein